MAVLSDLPPSTSSNRKPDRGHVIVPVLALAASMLLVLPTSTIAQSHYTKISNAGYMLPSAAQLGDGPYDWACTRDNRTGLTWEVKRTSGLRDYRHNYAWRWSGVGHNGNTASCSNSLSPASCNAQALASRYNGIALCGSSNWRVPLGTYAGGPYTNSPDSVTTPRRPHSGPLPSAQRAARGRVRSVCGRCDARASLIRADFAACQGRSGAEQPRIPARAHARSAASAGA